VWGSAAGWLRVGWETSTSKDAMDGIRRLSDPGCRQSPYGGKLTLLQITPARASELKADARGFPSLTLSPREQADLELLASGVFSPLSGFMTRADYESVYQRQRLADGLLWPVPVTLSASLEFASRLHPGARVALRDAEGAMNAVLTVSEVWEPDWRREAEFLYGTDQGAHPEVRRLFASRGRAFLAGDLDVAELPGHPDFSELRHPPAALRAEFAAEGGAHLVGYVPRHLMHRAHVEFTRRACLARNAALLILGAVGRGCEEANHYARARALRAVLEHYPGVSARLNLTELSVRRCGARAALLNAIVARNYGCTHFIQEHDHADTGTSATGEPGYGRYSAQAALLAHAHELGLEIIPFRDLVYEEDHPEHFLTGGRAAPRARGAGFPAILSAERAGEIARWFSYPAVLAAWQKPFRGRTERGLTLFFTGLSGAGKSTLARLLVARLMEIGERHTTLLDGDVVRHHLSAELGFSRAHRDINVLRLGYVASLITEHRGIAVCAPIAPYAGTRAQVRALIEPHGDFVEIYVSTPLETCEARDRKGLYARARAGAIKEFTGVSDPYEPPERAELVINTAEISAPGAVDRIIAYLTDARILAAPEGTAPPHPEPRLDTMPDSAEHLPPGQPLWVGAAS
jgi:sulfate adenylyltransferase